MSFYFLYDILTLMKKKEFDVFVSYSHKDKKFAERLSSDLISQGIKVWLDEKGITIGDSIIDRLRNGIDQSNFLAVVLSPASIASEWVKREVDIATIQEISSKKKKVLPLMIKRCELPWFLEGKYYADFTKSYTKGLKTLFSAVKPELNILKTIDTSWEIDLVDKTGNDAIIKRVRKVICIQGCVTDLVTCLTLSGSVKNIETTPMLSYTQRDCGFTKVFNFRLNSKLKERESFELLERYNVANCFYRKKEFWSIFNRTTSCIECPQANTLPYPYCEVKVTFPLERPFKSIEAVVRSSNQTGKPKSMPKVLEVNGKKEIFWRTKRDFSQLYAEHVLYWTW